MTPANPRKTTLIMGAAGRDFHNFNVVFRDSPRDEVVAFTASQIPRIEGRMYPSSLSGPLYPKGIPIRSETELEDLIRGHKVDQVVLSYSDLSYEEVMHKASRVVAAGADFRLLGAEATMLRSSKPVLSVCAVRTGCGKSPATRRIASLLREQGVNPVVVRHPMPYGDLAVQAVQRFATVEDLQRENCTIEEMEDYEPHLLAGNVVYAGVDYEKILRRAEEEGDIILWDGGNNDTPFFSSDLEIVLLDPHRAGQERRSYPGEINFLRADVLIVNKVDTADARQVDRLVATARTFNPKAEIIRTAMPVSADPSDAIRGARVLVIEDGPTVTHGGMEFGAGQLAARKFGATEIVDAEPHAVGTIRETYERYPHLCRILPAVGYGPRQIADLEETIKKVPCDLVLVATPMDLRRVIHIGKPTVRITYALEEAGEPRLPEILKTFLARSRVHA